MFIPRIPSVLHIKSLLPMYAVPKMQANERETKAIGKPRIFICCKQCSSLSLH